ncbi:MAG: hypothetical protein Q7S96_05015 [bacterium]|nr:hypothetical protein [bacterium]
MERESRKVFLASALGAGVGSLVALEVQVALWWIGIIAGGAVGYLSYEWRTVVATAPRAWRDAKAWRSPADFWVVFPLAMLIGTSMTALLIMGMVGMLAVSSVISGELSWWTTPMGTVDGAIRTMVCGAILSSIFGLIIALDPVANRDHELRILRTPTAKRMLWYVFPPIFLCYHLPKFVLRECAAAVRFLARFIRELSIRIFSERRLTCGVCVMLGAAAGHFFGFVLIGAFAGGIFGLATHELIARRVLRVNAR